MKNGLLSLIFGVVMTITARGQCPCGPNCPCQPEQVSQQLILSDGACGDQWVTSRRFPTPLRTVIRDRQPIRTIIRERQPVRTLWQNRPRIFQPRRCR